MSEYRTGDARSRSSSIHELVRGTGRVALRPVSDGCDHDLTSSRALGNRCYPSELIRRDDDSRSSRSRNRLSGLSPIGYRPGELDTGSRKRHYSKYVPHGSENPVRSPDKFRRMSRQTVERGLVCVSAEILPPIGRYSDTPSLFDFHLLAPFVVALLEHLRRDVHPIADDRSEPSAGCEPSGAFVGGSPVVQSRRYSVPVVGQYKWYLKPVYTSRVGP